MKTFPLMILMGACFALAVQNARAQVQVGLAAGVGGDSFHLAIGSYYQAPPEQVTVCQQQNVPDEEQPVVFFVARQVNVAPAVIIDLRAHGMSWVSIFRRYRLNPRILYVPIHATVAGTPYAGFYTYYRHGGRVRLADADIINMVNLRFASEYYHRPPEEIIRMRAGGHDYRYIHDHYRPHPGQGPGNGEHRGWDKDHNGQWRQDNQNQDDHRQWNQGHPDNSQDNQWQRDNQDQDHHNWNQDHGGQGQGDQGQQNNWNSDQDHRDRDRRDDGQN